MRSLILLVLLFACFHSAFATENTIAASLTGSFTGSVTGNGIQQSVSNATGVLLELRHIHKPWSGFEVNYAFHPANQQYNLTTVQAGAQHAGLDWVFSTPRLFLLPIKVFAVGGGAVIFVNPNSGQSDTKSNTKLAFEYGVGVDYAVIPHIGLRGQYRGNVYSAPALSNAFSSTNQFLKESDLSIGAYLRF